MDQPWEARPRGDPALERALAAPTLADARRALIGARASRDLLGADRLLWAEAAASLGLLDVAQADLTALENETPRDPETQDRLRTLQAELAEAGACLGPDPQRSQGSTPAPKQRPEGGPRLRPDAADLVRFATLFGGRQDAHARQWYDPRSGRSGYSPVCQGITPALVEAHLSGKLTLGAYVLSPDETVGFFALDLDLRGEARRAAERSREDQARLRSLLHETGLRLCAASRKLGLTLLLEDSGYKGRHLWGFFADPTPASTAARLARRVLAAAGTLPGEVSAEVFPKQTRLEPGKLGSLIKLPLGVHRRSGRRAQLLGTDGQPAVEPWALLASTPRLSRQAAERLAGNGDCAPWASGPLRAPGGPRTRPLPRATADAPWRSRDLRRLLAGCPLLATVAGTTRGKAPTREEALALRHTLGFLDSGQEALATIVAAFPGSPARLLSGGRLRGNPASCKKLRRRLPRLAGLLPCRCDLSEGWGYPTPIAHVLHGPGEETP